MSANIKGAKAGESKARQPKVAADSAQSKTYIKVLYGLSQGKIKGLVKGNQSIYLDDTPLEDSTGSKNFQDVTVDIRLGSNDQEYIEGFPDISSETAIGTELKSESPWVKAFTNLDLDAVRVRLKWGPLREQNADNGDVNGITILYAIDVQTDGGTWTEVLNTKISDKTSANYERTHRIDLPEADTGWQIRVRRLTPNSTSEFISDKMYVEAIAEVIDAKLRYPNTALLGLQYDAETFSNVAKIAVECDGIEILVPSNYNAETRVYSGLWDGTFKRAYTNNPAWHFYDECLSIERINASMIDKWSIYRLAQYCDELVPDGRGAQEPRFTLNIYQQSQEDAWTVLSKMAGVFRAFIYWNGSQIVCDADVPQDTYFTYTRANVIDGNFEYSGTRARDRHTVGNVSWDNPQNRYKTETLPVRDEKAISKLGVQIVDISAWGCTSEGQAQRAGLWALKSEQFETRTVTFKVGLDGFIPLPGKVIEIADELFAGRANGGRISAVSADLKKITLDRDDVVCRAGDRLVVNGEDGKAQARLVQSISGRVITVVAAFNAVAAQNVWVIDAQDLATMKFRVTSITQDDEHQFTITGLQYNPLKYDAIDHGAFIDDRPISIVNPKLQDPVSNVVISSENMVQQGLTVATMLIAWDQAQGATKYQVEWRKNDGSWLKLPITGNNSVEIQGIYSGQYEAKVTAISAFDVASLPTYSVLTELKGKQGKPPKLANIHAEGILFGMKLTWLFPAVGALDTAYTEIEVSPDGISNIAQLGLFAYPTTVHTIQGMQPNLRQFYRGRLIDRIGNVGDWSDWTSATSSADASAVLDILNEQITETQLHKDLQGKIDRIGEMDGDIADIIQSVQNVENGITQERNERIAGDNQVLNELTIYKLSNDQKVAAVVEDVDLLVDAQQVQAIKIEGIYAQVNPPLIGSVSDLIGNSGGYAGIWSEQSARIEADLAQAMRTDTVQTELNGNKAAVQEVTQSVNGLYAQKYTKLDVNGKVIGWGGANDGVEGKYIFNVDSLAIGSGDSAGYYPFIFRTTPFTDPITGTVFPVSAYLKSAMMDYQSVKTSHIEDLAVKTAKIEDLAVTAGKIKDLAVGTLKIQDEAVTVPTSIKSTNEFVVSGAYNPQNSDYNAQLAEWESKFGNLLAVTVNRAGGKCRIDASCIAFKNDYLTAYAADGGTLSYVERLNLRAVVSIYRNGALVARQETPPTDVMSSGGFYFTGTFAVNAGIEDIFSGQATYVLKLGFANRNARAIRITLNSSAGIFSIQNPQMILTEMKK